MLYYILYLFETLSMLLCIYIQLPLLLDKRALFEVSKSDKDKKGGGEYKGRKRGHIYLKVEGFYNKKCSKVSRSRNRSSL